MRWEQLWGVPGLAGSLEVTFSKRLRTSLGRTTPTSGKVRLHPCLLQVKPAVLLEVLCHEAAHVAIARKAAALRTQLPRPHGQAWAALVSAAGYQPHCTSTKPDRVVERHSQRGGRSGRSLESKNVVHLCPVCHMQRRAKRTVRAWRCAACVANGLPGELVTIKVATSGYSEQSA